MKKLQISDYVIIGLIVIGLLVGGFIMLKHKKISGLPETVDKKVYFQVMIRGVSITDNELPFKDGDEAFISIRNVPYTKLKITSVSFDRRKEVISANNQNGFLIVEDVSVPFLFDFIVTLEDNGKWTSDGYVLGGNKLKLGIPITLEGAKYKFNGTVSNIKSAEEVLQMEIPEDKQAKQ
ncbi:DUF4330 domain-containing protein [bacterium]|nr:DUF4330 domain-containing protein [bacterium]